MLEPLSERMARYNAKVGPDAGTGHMVSQRQGNPGEVYRCPEHAGVECELCGGSGYRAVCDSTACHEYGCQSGSCGRSEDDYLLGKRAAVPTNVP